MFEFTPFAKIPSLSRECVITEKIDGINASIFIGYDENDMLIFRVGSRNKWITPEDDNYRFAKWAYAHQDELVELGPGHHFGEWWGSGIQRGYSIPEKRFSLFNSARWSTVRPSCCNVVPVIAVGTFNSLLVDECLERLRQNGSFASPGFTKPEGIIIYHTASKTSFKKTLEKDESPKRGSLA